MNKLICCAISALVFFSVCRAYDRGEVADETYRMSRDISYVSDDESDSYRLQRCKLDLYYPTGAGKFATVVWFHGGGLTEGNKHLLDEFRRQGFAVASVNYRLYPGTKCPGYIQDSAQAAAWVMKNIASFGGDPTKVYLSGHSAGGYLALMLALDKSYMAEYGADADKLAGAFPISGQCATHYTIRLERGLPTQIPIVDQYAPLNCVRKCPFPITLITGDRKLELMARYEENLYLYTLLKTFGSDVTILEMSGFDHGTVMGPASYYIRSKIK